MENQIKSYLIEELRNILIDIANTEYDEAIMRTESCLSCVEKEL